MAGRAARRGARDRGDRWSSASERWLAHAKYEQREIGGIGVECPEPEEVQRGACWNLELRIGEQFSADAAEIGAAVRTATVGPLRPGGVDPTEEPLR
jgi:hypothetical protein